MHFGRVRELVLDDPSKEALEEAFVSQFHNLEVLEISDDFPSLRDLGIILNDSHVRAGCIRRLILRSFSIDWNSTFLQGLTHLQLASIPGARRLGCRDFLLILSKIPRLETLNLDGFIKKDKNFKAVKVHLLHLRDLSVECMVPTMAQFLPCLVVPRSCKLDIRTGNEYDKICDEFRAILSWVSNQLRVPTTPSNAGEQYIRSFHLLHDADNVDFTVEGFSDLLSHEQMETADPILKFVVFWTYEDDNFSFNLQTFLSLLPLQGMAFLDVVTDFNVYLSSKFWRVAFGSIQTLNEIYLNTRTSNFWKALALTSENSAVKSLTFPALTSITVNDWYLKSQRVLDKLRIRSELGGTRLQSLVLAGECRVPAEQVITHLGELVSRIQAVESGGTESPDQGEDISLSDSETDD